MNNHNQYKKELSSGRLYYVIDYDIIKQRDYHSQIES